MRRSEINALPEDRLRDNILSVWYSANDVERDEGARWYKDAREMVRKLAERHAVSINVAAAVVSILSPSNRWSTNVEDADRLLEAWRLGLPVQTVRASTYKQNTLKAWYMLVENSDPDEMFTNRAPKTRAFYWSLRGDNPLEIPVVDGHMVAIALGYREPLEKVPDIRGTPYARITHAIHDAAAIVGVPVEVMQATVWLAWRNEHLEERYIG